MTKKGYKPPPKDVELPEKPPSPPPQVPPQAIPKLKPRPGQNPPRQPHACTCSQQPTRCFWYNPDNDSCKIAHPHPAGCGPNCTDYFIWGERQSAVQQKSQPRSFVEINPQIATGTKAVLMLDDFSFFDVRVEPEPVIGLLSVKVRGLQVKNGRWADLFCFQHKADGKAEVAAYKVLNTIQAAIEHRNRAATELEFGGLQRLHAAMDEYEMYKAERDGEILVSLICENCEAVKVAYIPNSRTGTRSVHWICPKCEQPSEMLVKVGVLSGP